MKQYRVMVTSLLMMSHAAMAAGDFGISNTAIDVVGTSVETTCVNTQGFYFEIGTPNSDKLARVDARFQGLPLHVALKRLLPAGWRVVYDAKVPINQAIRVNTNENWREWLRLLSQEKNLSIILNWPTQTVYVNRL